MKANYKKHCFHTDEEIKRYIELEWEKRSEQVFQDCKRDIIAQLMSVCCVELNQEFGFGAERLNKFKNGVSNLFKLMATDGIFNKPFTPDSCIEIMQEKYGINFD